MSDGFYRPDGGVKTQTVTLEKLALEALLYHHRYLTGIRVKHSGGLKFKVTGELYHDLDRAPSYTSIETVLDGLGRGEAERLKDLLESRAAG